MTVSKESAARFLLRQSNTVWYGMYLTAKAAGAGDPRRKLNYFVLANGNFGESFPNALFGVCLFYEGSVADSIAVDLVKSNVS